MASQPDKLNPCGCCEGVEALTPAPVENRPLLPELTYRIGTHAKFRESMQAALAGQSALREITRDSADPTLALFDGWATVLDVLSFYQERIANEGYLRTATERRSILELARRIGFELAPGVAAETHLAFEMETAPGAPASAVIAAGTKVQSVPGQDELPQTFETVEEVEARPEWNELKPRVGEEQRLEKGTEHIHLAGRGLNLDTGDAILVTDRTGETEPELAIITTVRTDPDFDRTTIELAAPLSAGKFKEAEVFVMRLRASLFGHNAPQAATMPKEFRDEGAQLIGGTAPNFKWEKFSISAIDGLDVPFPDPENALELTGESQLESGDTVILFEGREPALLKEDALLLFVGDSNGTTRILHQIKEAEFINEETRTKITLVSPVGRDFLKVSVFGDPLLETLAPVGRAAKFPVDVTDAALFEVEGAFHLDRFYPEITATSRIVLLDESNGNRLVARVLTAKEDSRTGFTLTSKTTRIEVDKTTELFEDRVRETTVLAAGEPLTLAERPLKNREDDAVLVPVEGNRIVLDHLLGGDAGDVDALRARVHFSTGGDRVRLRSDSKPIDLADGDELEVLAVPNERDSKPVWKLRTADGIEGTIPKDASLQVFPAHEYVTGLRSGKSLIVSGKRLRATPKRETGETLENDDGAPRTVRPGESLLLVERPGIVEPDSDGQFEFRLRTDDGFEGTLKAKTGALTFLPAREDDEAVCERVTIRTVRPEDGKTVIDFNQSLENFYDRPTVVLHANVARGTHGESKSEEVLGSGDGSAIFQKFALKNKPLTHIPATTPSGTDTTLSVRVNRVLWEEVPNFFGSGPEDRVYTARRADDGTVTVQFGDGINGSRLPTGVENVTADYRNGIGLPGLLEAGQLKQLMSRPLGVKGVKNPLAPSGAEDPESRDDARANAPRTVVTLDRVVSLRDYEDFARAYAGVSKALAAELWQGEQRVVHLTVSGVAGGTAPIEKLRTAIDGQRHSKTRVVIQAHKAKPPFTVKARVVIDPAYLSEEVLEQVERQLGEQFSFDRRRFGQGVTASEVIAAIQAVAGVVAVDLEELDKLDPFKNPNVTADIATWEKGSEPRPAELLTIDPDGIEISELKPGS